MYAHESRERQRNNHPMCTELPTRCVLEDIEFEMLAYLEQRHLDPTLAQENGWYPSLDAQDCYPRIVISAITHKAGHVYWQARDITGKAFIRYQSPQGPRHEALVRVFPYDKPLGIVIVEGPMDALAAAGEGYVGIALMGMTPSKATLYHLFLLIEDNRELDTLVVLDRDSAANGIRICLAVAAQGYTCRIATLPEKDLAKCLPEVRRKFLKQNFCNLFNSKD